MIRNASLALASIVLVGAAFLGAFLMWNHQTAGRAAALGVPYTEFNIRTAHGLERGCNACHGGQLAAAVNRLAVPRERPARHGIFETSYGIPMRVEDCLICHGKAFAVDIHSLHLHAAAFVNMGGNCDSCHATIDGQFVLYDDEARYNVLNGVKTLPTPEFAQPSADNSNGNPERAASAH